MSDPSSSRRAAVVLTLALAVGAAQAGRTCEDKPATVQTIRQGMQMALKTAGALDQAHVRDGTSAVLLARAGQDLTRYNLKYSHLGIAYKTPEGPWRVVHKLNQCGTAEAAVFRQGLAEFFLDNPWKYEAAWVVPTPEVQRRLVALAIDAGSATRVHAQAYSMVSYAWGERYQQSNQWALESLAVALDDSIRTRAQAQAWLRLKDYRPTTLALGPLTRLGGRITAANLAFDDHPNDRRFSNQIDTVTVDSVFEWLQRSGLSGQVQTLGL